MFFNFLVSPKKEKISLNRIRQTAEGGFGLVELMVSVTIMVLVSSIVIVNQGAFNTALLHRGQAYEVALRIREVQLAAVSANYNGQSFRSSLGLYFVSGESRYDVFRDSENNGYDSDGSEVYDLEGYLDDRYEIGDIRINGDQNEVSVVFTRPNFDARFFDSSNIEITSGNLQIDIAKKSDPTKVKTVEVTRTGQISVLE